VIILPAFVAVPAEWVFGWKSITDFLLRKAGAIVWLIWKRFAMNAIVGRVIAWFRTQVYAKVYGLEDQSKSTEQSGKQEPETRTEGVCHASL
jgi:hypothetical protein